MKLEIFEVREEVQGISGLERPMKSYIKAARMGEVLRSECDAL